jgi:hypothetical protein
VAAEVPREATSLAMCWAAAVAMAPEVMKQWGRNAAALFSEGEVKIV